MCAHFSVIAEDIVEDYEAAVTLAVIYNTFGNSHVASGRLSTQHLFLRALFLAPNEAATSQSSTRDKTAPKPSQSSN
jgi:hypothetical protein